MLQNTIGPIFKIHYHCMLEFVCSDKCSSSSSWVKFVEFLEKVQPAKTGLTIPRSKKPLEYAKQVPSPVRSWPRAVENNPVQQGQQPVTPLWRKDVGVIF